MDAHTLNAWTRFALQKGGIGSCTALVDNPATDAEDLMFMTGEKIIVLRRLDDAAESPTRDDAIGSSRRKSNTHEDAWFLGYCEGVVGKFRGAHVQIHGKLKKPVLMRRSGQGQIRESSTQPMSQGAAASLPESQVPVGLPVSSVDSEGEDGSQTADRSPRTRVATTSDRASLGKSIIAEASSSVGHMSNGRSSPNDNVGSTAHNVASGSALPSLNRQASYRSTSQDSDDSDTILPWARPPVSAKSSQPSDRVDTSAAAAARVQVRGPSGLEVEEPSPVESRGGYSTGSGHKSVGSGHIPNSPSQDSNITASTDESEDDFSAGSRRDHTFSIYDVYGRDSVAFPNFSLQGMLPASETAQSIKLESEKHPTPPLAPEHVRANMLEARIAPTGDVAARLRASPSGRRPNAAPDPRAPPHQGRAVASNLRYQVEANSPQSDVAPELPLPPAGPRPALSSASAPGSPALVQNDARLSGPRSGLAPIDTSRQPPFADARQGQPPHVLSHLRIPQQGTIPAGPRSSESPSSAVAMPQGVPRPGQTLPTGFGPGGFIPANGNEVRSGSPGPRGMQGELMSASPTGSHLPPGVLNAVGPKRASSDRTSQRERIGSGQLRKNPSNPSPGSYGGSPIPAPRSRAGGSFVDVLSPPPRSVGGSRSPSPLATSPAGTIGKLPSPIDPSMMSRSVSPAGSLPVPMSRPNGAALGAMNGRSASYGPSSPGFDAKGFRLGLGPPCRSETEDADAVAKWREIIADNDLTAAKKSRKVRKLVQAGIPASIRGQAWLFLSNASVRRRPGLFEQLCVTSRSVKGKKGKEVLYETIEKDVSRTYPDNRMFEEGSSGKADLEAILKAYVHYNPIIGYTQGMGLLVGMFLLHMAAEDAFWLLCALLRDIHMEGYYSTEMKQMHIDGVILGQLLQSMDAPLASKLQSLGVEPINFTPNWLLPLFCRVLPWPTVIRVWDVFFYEGPQWILQTSLSVIRIIRQHLMAASGPSASEDVLRLLLHPPPQELTPENVISCACTVKLKDGEMRKLSRNASKLVRDSQGGRGRRGSAAPLSAGAGGGPNAAAAPVVPARR
ncbi:unnamed protein product [Parajaminaea phylloscopi]